MSIQVSFQKPTLQAIIAPLRNARLFLPPRKAPQQFKTLSLTTSLLNPCTLHSCMQKGSSKADMPTSSAAAPPLPTQLLCKHTQHTHTAELNSTETKEIRCCWQPQSHHLRKRQWSCFYDVQGTGKSVKTDRSVEKMGCSFRIKHLLGCLHYFPSIPSITSYSNTYWLAVSVCHLAVWQIIDTTTNKTSYK